MRGLIATTLAASLFATSLFAADQTTPLPAGKAAGVKAAQGTDNTALWIVALAGIGGLAALALTQNTTPTAPAQPSGTGATTST